MDKEIETKDAFLQKMKKEHGKSEKEADSLKADKFKMEDIIHNVYDMPEKIHIVNEIGKVRTKSDVNGLNAFAKEKK